MKLEERRSERAHPGLFSAAFWVTVTLAVYLVLLSPDWWVWLLLTVSGVAATYGWLRRRRWMGTLSLVFAAACALFALLSLFGGARFLFATASVPADSIGPRVVVCGSVVTPVPGDQLQVTDADSGDPVVQSRPIPQSELERVCTNELHYRTSAAAGLILVGLLLGVRSVSHARPARDSI